jgi:hypothetical protein
MVDIPRKAPMPLESQNVRPDRSNATWTLSLGRASSEGRAEQIPPVAGDVEEHGDLPVGLSTRRGDEFDAGSGHALVGGVEVVHAEEESDASGHLVAYRGGLPGTVRAGEQEAGFGIRRPDDDPPLGATIVGQRWRVFDQVEAQDVSEELDGGFVFVYDDRDQGDSHARRRRSQTAPNREGGPVALVRGRSRAGPVRAGCPCGRHRSAGTSNISSLPSSSSHCSPTWAKPNPAMVARDAAFSGLIDARTVLTSFSAAARRSSARTMARA